MKTRKDKLVFLKDNFLNTETGEVYTSAFEWENSLYEKSVQKKVLDTRIRRCSLCPGLNIKRFTESTSGYGNLNAKVFFIGQSLHKPGVVSGIPFILGSGYILDAALRLSGLLRKDVFISNVVHCHPERNRASTDEEKKNCLGYLKAEIGIVKPVLLIALGNDAQWSIEEMAMSGFSTMVSKVLCIKHPASFMYASPELRVDWIIKLSLEIDKVYL